MWHEHFPSKAADTGLEGVEDVAGVEESEVPVAQATAETQDYLVSLEQKLPRSGVLLAELFDKVHKGDFWEDATKLMKEPNPEQVLLDLDVDKLPKFAKEVKSVLQALRAAETVVSAAGGAAPKPSFRELARAVSDGADPDSAQQERETVWKQAVQLRKKFVNFARVQNQKSQASYVEVRL